MKKILAIMIILLITFNMPIMGATKEGINYQITDIEGHWGYDVMSKWINNDYIFGYPDGTYRPDYKITIAEFLTIVNRVFGFYEISEENYDDVDTKDWFSDQTSIARKNGYMDWYERDKLNANNNITRQEVSAILTFINNIEKSNDLNDIQFYKDKLTIPKWSRGYIDAVVRKGYLKGYEDNTIRHDEEITRAEAVYMLDRVVGELISKEGTYGPVDETNTIDGNLTINTKAVVLQNTIINGDLILSAGIKEGEVELKNVTIKGQTIINGGGENSITFTNCNVGKLFVLKINGRIRVVSKESNFVKVYLKSGGKLEGKYKGARVEILGKGQKVEFEGDFNEIIVESKALIKITDDTQIDLLEISKKASDTQIDTDNKSEIKEIIFRAATK